MSFGKVASLFVIFVSMVDGIPRGEDETAKDRFGPPPFIQFTNGGIRLNFGGYHAEAGLGGLLRGAGTGGGLHASVGTPWGAHAGAGLGGRVGGSDVGGGLYARAGLGHGRPEAAAGLGGSIDGRSLNPISGGMYAGATSGGPGTGVYLGGGLARDAIDAIAYGTDIGESGPANPQTIGARMGEAGATAANATAAAGANANADGAQPTRPRGRTNIQIIPSKPKNAQKENEKVVLEAVALQADAPADGKTESPRNNEIRRAVQYAAVPPVAEVGVFKSLSAGVTATGTAPIVKSIEKNIVISAPAAVAVPAENATRANTTVDVIKAVDNNPGTIVTKPVYPRWYFRKRFWAVPRKSVYLGSPVATDTQDAPSDVVDRLFVKSVGKDGGDTVVASKTYAVSGSLFDDIFNIPISTLSAVNQLLRNNVG